MRKVAELSPLVRAAIAALDAFGALSQAQARVLLGLWVRRDELTNAEVVIVLSHYPTSRRVPVPSAGRD